MEVGTLRNKTTKQKKIKKYVRLTAWKPKSVLKQTEKILLVLRNCTD